MSDWPEKLFDLIYFPVMDEKLDELAELAESEKWDYISSHTDHHLPVLYNYIQHTYSRLAFEDKIVVSDNGECLTFNTGLVTSNQEPIFSFANTNRNEDSSASWYFQGWKRRGEFEMTKFSMLPEMAHYFNEPSALVFDARKELRTNIEHIVTDNKDRFPEPYRSMDDYSVQTFLKGAIDNVKERVRRNYKTAIPHYYRGEVQLLLPLCLGNPSKADLAIVAKDYGTFYRASTCLTLDMAYNNARQLARPDRDWLLP